MFDTFCIPIKWFLAFVWLDASNIRWGAFHECGNKFLCLILDLERYCCWALFVGIVDFFGEQSLDKRTRLNETNLFEDCIS